MSKLNQIQNALEAMDGGRFQKLADSYLIKKGHQNINPIGSFFGADKTTKGTPDSYLRQENGKLVFVEYTTDKTDISKKLNADLDKCLNPEKTGIQLNEIEEIIFIHNSKSSLADEQQLYRKCKENGIKIQVYGLGAMSFDLYQKYPALARDFLGVTVDTGQISTPEDFIGSLSKNKISTPLDTNFLGRKEDLRSVLNGLEGGDLVILSGGAGVGKSRLALEALEEFKKQHSGFELFVVHGKGLDLYEDIRSYFSAAGNFLILLDDANRVTQFKYIVDLIQNQRNDQNIKVIATVRDYAREKIRNDARVLGNVPEIFLEPMSDEEIAELVKAQYRINHPVYLERIANISAGNPRLAIMAAMVAVKENTLESIRDVSSLYEEYFSSVSNDLGKLNDKNVLKVAGVISFFRNIDKSNSELMELIRSVFGLEAEEVWECIEYLHASEIVDIYENEVAKITDQVLATYLFYLCFLKDKSIDFSVLLDNFFPSHTNKLKDALYPCFNTFNYEFIAGQVSRKVKSRWGEAVKTSDWVSIKELAHAFWFILQADVLGYVRNEIESLEESYVDLSTLNFDKNNVYLSEFPILETLALFKSLPDENVLNVVLDLAFQFVSKVQKASPQFVKLVADNFGFSRNSHLEEYKKQQLVVNKLWSKTKNGNDELFSRLFVEAAARYLQTQFDGHESSKGKVQFYRAELLPIEPVFEIREVIWKGLSHLYKSGDLKSPIFNVIKRYTVDGFNVSQKEIIEKDAEHILCFVNEALDPESFKDCLLAQKCRKFLASRNIESAVKIGAKYDSKVYALYKILSLDYTDVDQGDIVRFEEIKKERIIAFTEGFDLCGYKTLLNNTRIILDVVDDGHKVFQIKNGISQILACIADKDTAILEELTRSYISSGNFLELEYVGAFINSLINAFGANKALLLLNTGEFPFKKKWLFTYYCLLSEEQITVDSVHQLLGLYSDVDASDIPYEIDYLLKYVHADKDIVSKVIRILLLRAQKEKRFSECLGPVFNHLNEVNKKLFDLVSGNLLLIEEAYLAYYRTEKHLDYNGATLGRILSRDPNFIVKVVETQYEGNEWLFVSHGAHDYNFLWGLENYESVIMAAMEEMLNNEQKKGYISGNYLASFLGIKNNTITPENIEKQDLFLKDVIADNASNNDLMKLIFGVVSQLLPVRRKQFVEEFLNKNQSYSEFTELLLEPTQWTWSGSAVPMYQGRANFWESLLPLCNTVELLEHKLYIENKVQGYMQIIENEKRKDFIGDD